MYKLEHNKVPILFNNNFIKITNHHKYGTRLQSPAPITFFLVSAKKLHRTNYLLTDAKINLQIKNTQWDSFTK